MDVEQANKVLKEKKDAKLSEVEAIKTLEDAKKQKVLDEQKVEEDKVEREKFLKKRQTQNEKTAIKMRADLTHEWEKGC